MDRKKVLDLKDGLRNVREGLPEKQVKKQRKRESNRARLWAERAARSWFQFCTGRYD